MVERNPGLLGQLLERRAFHELHHHDELVVVLEGGAQLRDAGMLEAGQGADLGHEPGGKIGVGGEVGQKDLHRLFAVGNHVANLVDAAHAARAEGSNHFIVADALTCFCHGILRVSGVILPG